MNAAVNWDELYNLLGVSIIVLSCARVIATDVSKLYPSYPDNDYTTIKF